MDINVRLGWVKEMQLHRLNGRLHREARQNVIAKTTSQVNWLVRWRGIYQYHTITNTFQDNHLIQNKHT